MATKKASAGVATSLLVILIAGSLFITQTDFKLELKNGLTYSYKEGISLLKLKTKTIYQNEVIVQCLEGKKWVAQKRDKLPFTNLKYTMQDNMHIIQQRILYQSGHLYRIFHISELGEIKTTQLWVGNDRNKICKIILQYSKTGITTNKVLTAEQGLQIFNSPVVKIDWSKTQYSKIEQTNKGIIKIEGVESTKPEGLVVIEKL